MRTLKKLIAYFKLRRFFPPCAISVKYRMYKKYNLERGIRENCEIYKVIALCIQIVVVLLSPDFRLVGREFTTWNVVIGDTVQFGFPVEVPGRGRGGRGTGGGGARGPCRICRIFFSRQSSKQRLGRSNRKSRRAIIDGVFAFPDREMRRWWFPIASGSADPSFPAKNSNFFPCPPRRKMQNRKLFSSPPANVSRFPFRKGFPLLAGENRFFPDDFVNYALFRSRERQLPAKTDRPRSAEALPEAAIHHIRKLQIAHKYIIGIPSRFPSFRELSPIFPCNFPPFVLLSRTAAVRIDIRSSRLLRRWYVPHGADLSRKTLRIRRVLPQLVMFSSSASR